MSETTPASTPQPPFDLSLDAWGRLVLTDAAGQRHVDVEPIRSFPVSDPRRHIALCDLHGRELVGVAALDDLPPELRTLLERELVRREFVPTIEWIENVTVDTEPTAWTVHTDRGRATFHIDGTDAVRRVGGDEFLITDVQGIRYRIASLERLDRASRAFLEHFF